MWFKQFIFYHRLDCAQSRLIALCAVYGVKYVNTLLALLDILNVGEDLFI